MAYEEVKVQTPLLFRVLPVVSIVAFFGIWEIIVDTGIVPDTMLAAPSQVASLFWDKLTNPNPDGALLHQQPG